MLKEQNHSIIHDQISEKHVNETRKFMVVDARGMGKALESGSKTACIVSQVLFHDQVCKLQKSPEWLEIFKSATLDCSDENPTDINSQQGEDRSALSSDDDNSGNEDDRLPH